MKLKVLPEETGLKNYGDSSHCPIATALRRKGFRFVLVGPDNWFGMWWFIIPRWGKIPDSINMKAIYMAQSHYNEIWEFEL